MWNVPKRLTTTLQPKETLKDGGGNSFVQNIIFFPQGICIGKRSSYEGSDADSAGRGGPSLRKGGQMAPVHAPRVKDLAFGNPCSKLKHSGERGS